MTDTNQKQLGNTLWSIADQLRGAMDADGFRDLAFMTRRIEENHFRGVTKMVPQVSTRRKPAVGFYQRSSSQVFLDYSNQRRKRVTEDSSATARPVAQGLFPSVVKATVKESLTVQIEQMQGGTAEEFSVVQKMRRRAAGRCCLPLSFIHFHE